MLWAPSPLCFVNQFVADTAVAASAAAVAHIVPLFVLIVVAAPAWG